MSEVHPQVLQNILDDLDESERLKTLSNEDLVRQWVVEESDLVVEEMASRLFPGWANEERGH